MDDKLIRILKNFYKQNYSFSRLNLLDKKFEDFQFGTNQSKINKSTKFWLYYQFNLQPTVPSLPCIIISYLCWICDDACALRNCALSRRNLGAHIGGHWRRVIQVNIDGTAFVNVANSADASVPADVTGCSLLGLCLDFN